MGMTEPCTGIQGKYSLDSRVRGNDIIGLLPRGMNHSIMPAKAGIQSNNRSHLTTPPVHHSIIRDAAGALCVALPGNPYQSRPRGLIDHRGAGPEGADCRYLIDHHPATP